MRLRVLTPTFLPLVGGAELAIHNLVRAWRAGGHDAGVVAPHPSGGRLEGWSSPGYPVHRHGRPLSTRGPFLGARRALARCHREAPLHLVNAHMAYPAGYAACRWARRHRVPVVVTCQGGDVSATSRFRRRPAVMARLRWCLNAADAVTAVATELVEQVAELSGGRRPELIPNGVDPEVAEPAAEPAEAPWHRLLVGRPFFLDMKRLHPAKGHDRLLRAYARARQLRADLPLLVVAGDGRERGALEALARRLGLAGSVVFTGHVEGHHKRWLLQGCLAFVHPSRREGMPLVVLEAMACGRPVLAVRAEGTSAQVVPGETGLVVEPGDEEALARGLVELPERGDLAALGAAAKRRAGELAWSRVAGRYEALFRRIVEERS